MKPIILIFSLLLSQSVLAETHQREHAAHVHGHASLNLAWSGQKIVIEFESPAMNLTGFEHKASSEQDKKILQGVLKTLRNPIALIKPNKEAGCKLEKVEIESSLIDEPDEEHHEEAEHADFDLSLVYRCESPQKLKVVDTSGLFESFSGMQEIEVQWLSDTQQSSKELSPDNALILLQ